MARAQRIGSELDRGERYVNYLRLDQVQETDRNPKGHAAADIARSINHFGLAELPLLDDRTGRLIAGHGRYHQLVAAHAGGQQPPDGVRVDADGVWMMPVICGWSSRSDDDAEAYLIASNQLAVKGGWDSRGLAEILTDLADAQLLDLTGFDDGELARLLEDINGTEELPPVALTDPDALPESPPDPVTKSGDVWLLGSHRLLCGDATNPEQLDLATAEAEVGIVYTDPPYGLDIVHGDAVGGGGPFGGVKAAKERGGPVKVIPTSNYTPVTGDATIDTACDAFRLLSTTYPAARHVWWGGNHYASSAELADASCWLVWDKENTGNFADAELAWTNYPGAVRLLRHMWNGMLRASERGGGQRVHPTQKPVALAEWAFGVVDPGSERRTVLDAFAGSGSTLIAAHRTQRTAFLIELEPHYVDVICRRWQEHTGIAPVLQSTNTEVDFARQPVNP